MNARKITIFAIGYSDNTSTAYLLDYLTSHGVSIDGAIFPKNQLKRCWKRLAKKFQARGFAPTIKRISENLFVRKRHIVKTCRESIKRTFFVNDINSEEAREIIKSNNVSLLLLVAKPIIKPIIIDINGLTILNPHTGWLPQYRGLDANLKALGDGHQLGVSIHRVTKEIDAGEVYLREGFKILYNSNIIEQIDRQELKLQGKLLVKAVELQEKNMLKPISLSEQLGKYEPPLTKKEKKRIIAEHQQRLATGFS